jgi:phage recombination protein Bet
MTEPISTDANGNDVLPVSVVALRERDSMTEFNPRDEEQRRLVRDLVLKDQDASDDEFLLFLHVAAHSGLDPLRRQIYGIRRKGKLTIQTGIDGYRAIAARTGLHAGTEDATYRGRPRNGDADKPGKATVVVYKIVGGLRVPFTASARWDEYALSGAEGWAWRDKPYLMLGKCAEALALRKAFPEETSGIEVEEAAGYKADTAIDAHTVEREKSRDELLRDRFDALPVAAKVRFTAWLQSTDIPKPGDRSSEHLDVLEAKLDEFDREAVETDQANPMPAVDGETCGACDEPAVADGMCAEHQLPPAEAE